MTQLNVLMTVPIVRQSHKERERAREGVQKVLKHSQ